MHNIESEIHCYFTLSNVTMGFPGGSVVKNPPAMQETWVPSLGQEDPLEEEMATHTSILAWKVPWTEEPEGLQSMGSQKSRTLLSTRIGQRVIVSLTVVGLSHNKAFPSKEVLLKVRSLDQQPEHYLGNCYISGPILEE